MEIRRFVAQEMSMCLQVVKTACYGHSAANTAVHHLDDLLLRLHSGILCQEGVINADIPKLVLDDCNLLAVLSC